MEVHFQVGNNKEIIDAPYRNFTGTLKYLATTSKPDVMLAVAYLSRILEKLTEETWEVAKGVLRYLKKTKIFFLA